MSGGPWDGPTWLTNSYKQGCPHNSGCEKACGTTNSMVAGRGTMQTTKLVQKSSVKENGVGNGNALPAAMLGRPFSGGGHPGRFLCDQTKVVRDAVL